MAERTKRALSPAAQDRYPIHAQILIDRACYRSKQEDVAKFRIYDRGEQESKMTEEMKEALFGLLFEQTGNRYSDNVFHQITFEAANRVVLKELASSNAAVNDWLKSFWLTAKVQDRQASVHYDTFRDGNHAILLQWDNDGQRVRFSREPWWDGSCGMFVKYDNSDEIAYAVNEWHEYQDDQTTKIIRRVIYFPDEIQRWASYDSGTTWEESPDIILDENDEEVEEPWPVPWLKTPETPEADGEPLHVPVIHFANAGSSSENYGLSEGDNGILAGQDQLNDMQWNMAAGGRQTAFQMYWATGVSLIDEDTGEVTKFKVGPGVWLTNPNPDAAFGTLASGDMSKLIAIYDKKLSRISQVSATPLHIITGGDWPSGEALLRAEQPAIGKARRQINRLDNAWILLAHRAVEIYNRFHVEGDPLEEDVKLAPISAAFEDPERRDPLSQSQIIQALGDRISDEEALRRMGYSDAEAKNIIKEKQAKQKADAEAFQTQFNRGTAPGTQLPGRGPVDNGQTADNNQTIPQVNP